MWMGAKAIKVIKGNVGETSVLIVGRVFEKIAAGNESGQIGMASIMYALPKNFGLCLTG